MSDTVTAICGETYDHIERATYADDEIVQWVCERCGAEGWESLD